MRYLAALFAGIALLAGAAVATAQEKRASPHDTVTATIGGKKVTITYGRPYMKGRKIMGGLVPYGQVWRTGADEATTLETTGDMMLGSLHVPAGTYALFTVPGEKEWTVILNKVAKQWGAFSYEKNKAQDLGKATAKVTALSTPVDQFTIELTSVKNEEMLVMSWEKTRVSVPIMMH